MPWKNQGGSPWGPGPKGPWGQGPQSQGPNPPDLEDLLRRGIEDQELPFLVCDDHTVAHAVEYRL